jgi:hypothetical protein
MYDIIKQVTLSRGFIKSLGDEMILATCRSAACFICTNNIFMIFNILKKDVIGNPACRNGIAGRALRNLLIIENIDFMYRLYLDKLLANALKNHT